MATLTAIALGVSFITTSFLSLHDTVKQTDHARGFVRFILTQDMTVNARTALSCMKGAIYQRLNASSQKFKSLSSDFVNQSFSAMFNNIQQKLSNLSFDNLIRSVRENQQEIIKQTEKQINKQDQNQKKQSGFWQNLETFKNAIYNQFSKQGKQYTSVRCKNQQKAIIQLYDIFRQSKGYRNDQWTTPYNVLMMIIFSVGSFFVPKLTIILAISYFISTQLYLLSDAIYRATKCQLFQNLKFDNVIQFHVAVMTGFLGYNRYKIYRESRGYPGSKYKGMSLSF